MALIGFDLDGTLIDSRPQILGSFAATARETRTAIDIDTVASRMGLKLEEELAHWFEAGDIPAAADIYRKHYLVAASQTVALPFAREALAELRRAGASTAIITAKHASTVGVSLAAAEITADTVVAYVHGPEKAEVLRDLAAMAYVGDTPPDMAAAEAAGVVGIGVATGSFSEADLRAAGATETMTDLRGLARHLALALDIR